MTEITEDEEFFEMFRRIAAALEKIADTSAKVWARIDEGIGETTVEDLAGQEAHERQIIADRETAMEELLGPDEDPDPPFSIVVNEFYREGDICTSCREFDNCGVPNVKACELYVAKDSDDEVVEE